MKRIQRYVILALIVMLTMFCLCGCGSNIINTKIRKDVVVEYGENIPKDATKYIYTTSENKTFHKFINSVKVEYVDGKLNDNNCPEVGIHKVKLSKWFISKTIDVSVQDTVPPTFTKETEEIEIYANQKADFNGLFEAEDLSNHRIEYDDKDVNYRLGGKYYIHVRAIDEYGNTSNRNLSIRIKEPTIKLTIVDQEYENKEKIQLAVEIDGPEQKAIFSSNYEHIATVDENGLVTAHKSGIVTIKATANGVSDACVLRLTAKNLSVSSLAQGISPGDGIFLSKEVAKKPTEEIFGKHYKSAQQLYNCLMKNDKETHVEAVFENETEKHQFEKTFIDTVLVTADNTIIKFATLKNDTVTGRYFYCIEKSDKTDQTCELAYKACEEAGLYNGMCERDAAIKIAQWIGKKMTYEINNGTDYVGFTTGYGQCSTYAQMFQAMCNTAGITTRYATGVAEEPHGWNKVKIGDEWYWMDVTWYDGSGDGQYILSKELWSTHILDSDSVY